MKTETNKALHRTPHAGGLFAKTRKKPASMLRQRMRRYV
jgi:hypothetical protein